MKIWRSHNFSIRNKRAMISISRRCTSVAILFICFLWASCFSTAWRRWSNCSFLLVYWFQPMTNDLYCVIDLEDCMCLLLERCLYYGCRDFSEAVQISNEFCVVDRDTLMYCMLCMYLLSKVMPCSELTNCLSSHNILGFNWLCCVFPPQ